MEKKIPCRLCIGCGKKRPADEMIRILKAEDGTVHVDDGKRREGRGAYLCKDPACFHQARKKKGLERSFHMAFSERDYDSLQKELMQCEKW